MRLLGQTPAQLASWWPGWAQLRAAPPRPPHRARIWVTARPAAPPGHHQPGIDTDIGPGALLFSAIKKYFIAKTKYLFAPADMSAGCISCGCVRCVCVRYWRAVARCGGWRPLRKYCTQLSCEKSAEWRRGTAARPSPATRHQPHFFPATFNQQHNTASSGAAVVEAEVCRAETVETEGR